MTEAWAVNIVEDEIQPAEAVSRGRLEPSNYCQLQRRLLVRLADVLCLVVMRSSSGSGGPIHETAPGIKWTGARARSDVVWVHRGRRDDRGHAMGIGRRGVESRCPLQP